MSILEQHTLRAPSKRNLGVVAGVQIDFELCTHQLHSMSAAGVKRFGHENITTAGKAIEMPTNPCVPGRLLPLLHKPLVTSYLLRQTHDCVRPHLDTYAQKRSWAKISLEGRLPWALNVR